MRRVGVLLVVTAAVCAAWLAPSSASAALYPQCPPVFHDTGCQFLVTVTSGGETIDDALVGVQNNSSSPITSIHLSAEDELFGFDGDGICDPGGAPLPEGCMVQRYSNYAEKTENTNKGKECAYDGETKKGVTATEEIEESCAFDLPTAEARHRRLWRKRRSRQRL
jgi:hypothetical protein